MGFRIFTEPQQGATYEDLLRVAKETERLGFDAFFRSDHYLAMGGDGLPRPDRRLDHPRRARPGDFNDQARHVGQRHDLSLPRGARGPGGSGGSNVGGRVELGLGAGWFEAEHTAYGIPFPPHRFDILTEQLQIISGLWGTPAGETFSFAGEHYHLTDSPALPKPAHPIPMIIGGHGPRRTPALAAQFASEFNTPFAPLDRVRGLFEGVRAACEKIDRDPDEITYSSAFVVCVGKDEEEFSR